MIKKIAKHAMQAHTSKKGDSCNLKWKKFKKRESQQGKSKKGY